MAGSFLDLSGCSSPTFHSCRSSTREKDDRKRKRETALISFDRTGSIEGMSSLAIADCPAPPTEPSMIVRSSHTPTAKGILKMRPILKGSQQERHKSKSPKKRKVVFDEKTLEELQKEKEHEPPKRKVDEHNTPYHDTWHNMPGDEDDPPLAAGQAMRRITPPSPKEGSHLHFHFNVQFNFTQPKVKSKIFREKTKELILEEGQMFKLMVKAKLPEPDDMEDDEMDTGSIEKILKEANLPTPSFWGCGGHTFASDDTNSPAPLSPTSPRTLLSQSPTSPNLHLSGPGRFLFHSMDELARGCPEGSPAAEDGSPGAATDAFVFSAPPSAVARPRSFTYCSGGGGSTG
eukprot:EG_transcript_16505